MTKFRKRPVIIDAEQFVIWDMNKIPPFVTIHDVMFPVKKDGTIVVPTLEGEHVASNLDWIIKGVKGELYPCKPDIFELTYEEVTSDPQESEKGCEWKSDGEGNYTTSCDNIFTLIDGNTTDNNMTFCPYCGKHLTES